MLMLISPAKTLDESQPNHAALKNFDCTQPQFVQEARLLAQNLQQKSPAELGKLMGISDALANLNYERFQHFSTPFSSSNSYPAIFAFKGDVYVPLQLQEYGKAELEFINQHLRILSGLYGLLRPLDYLYPYRLEMGTKLKHEAHNNLYEFWGDKITQAINDIAPKVVVNLASQEYFKAVKPQKLNTHLINVEFKERKGDAYKVVGIHAKAARGMMVNYVVRNGLQTHTQLQSFNEAGYAFAPSFSDDNNYIFVR
jgi:cytoplasmic iron level regulating protein YaaA (DUF328/UPF0246 family)